MQDKENDRKDAIEFQKEFGIDHMVCGYSKRGVHQLASVISYRVERAQNELWREEYGEVTWKEYLYFLSGSKQMQENARCALLQAQRDFKPELFDFEQLKRDQDEKEDYFVRLLEESFEEVFVILFLFKAELEHHRRVCASRGDACSVARYMQALKEDEALMAALRAGFEDAVRRLDFRAAWRKTGYAPPEDLKGE